MSTKTKRALKIIGIAIISAVFLGNSVRICVELLEKAERADEPVCFQYDEEKVEKVISVAEELADANDYEGALKKIQAGLMIFPKLKVLEEKSEEYIWEIMHNRAQYLLEVCTPYEYTMTSDKTEALCKLYVDGETFSMDGTEYSNGFTFSEVSNQNMQVRFDLGRNYSLLKFDVGCVDGFEGKDRTLNIYLDNSLVYDMVLTSDSTVQQITIDLDNVKDMCIEMPRSSVISGVRNPSRSAFGLGNIQVCPKLDSADPSESVESMEEEMEESMEEEMMEEQP